MRRILIFLMCWFFLTGSEAFAFCRNQECKSPRFIHRTDYNRAAVYNALNLSDEQIKTFEDMVLQNVPCYEEKYKLLEKETCRLRALQKACAEENEIIKQKRVVKCIENEIVKLQEIENKKFEKCLTRDQRNKYKMIKKLERDDAHKECRKKNLYKENPQMRAFGNPEPCSCPPKNCKR